MPLADDIRALQNRALSELDAAHDYYTDTKVAWLIVRRLIASGRRVRVRNRATGTETTEADLAAKAPGYVAEQLAAATFQQFISIFENFVFDLLRLWLGAHPQSLGGKKFDLPFGDVLDAPDKDAVVSLFIDRELIGVAYGRPADWFAYIEAKVHVGCPSPDEIERFTEAKASRDVLAHNRGIANKLYETKAGRLARYKPGQRLEIPEHYHRECWTLLRKLVQDISDAAVAKA